LKKSIFQFLQIGKALRQVQISGGRYYYYFRTL
jgi:hypothetical protein